MSPDDVSPVSGAAGGGSSLQRGACRRCEWVPAPDAGPPRGQLSAHAEVSGHAVCSVCGWSLPVLDRGACVPCVADVRRRLARVVEVYAFLPSVLGAPVAARLDADWGRGSRDRPVPGGDALVMLGPGGGGEGLPSDPPAVAFELGVWEDDWRRLRGDPAADCLATVAGAAGYLSVNAGWAAHEHPAFADFVADLRRILGRLEVVSGWSDSPVVGVPCFDCGADLLRRLGEDSYSCPRCRRVYDGAGYWLAVRAALEAGLG